MTGTAASDAGERLAVADALLRFAAGVDAGDAALLASAFAPDAAVDFRPCGERLGLDFGVLHGQATIVGFLAGTAERQVTNHAVTNPRTGIDGDGARLSALVDAVHIVRAAPATRFRMMNRYDAELRRGPGDWTIDRLTITNIWFDGDPRVLLTRKGAGDAAGA